MAARIALSRNAPEVKRLRWLHDLADPTCYLSRHQDQAHEMLIQFLLFSQQIYSQSSLPKDEFSLPFFYQL